ncbi:hypothetical protein AMK33_22970 [Streptomyces sp. CB02400]|nr:hypothetical protein AMK33_22970 [Streptomyces sp. CB02400]
MRALGEALAVLRAREARHQPFPTVRHAGDPPGTEWEHVAGPLLSRAHRLVALTAYERCAPAHEYGYGRGEHHTWNVCRRVIADFSRRDDVTPMDKRRRT